MARSTKYRTQRALAAKLGTDGSLVGKWLNGKVLEIQSISHRRQLPRLLKTPADYFSDPPRSDRLAEVEEEAGDLRDSVQILLGVADLLVGEVVKLGGTIPQETRDALAQATAGRRA
jgi:transcriptional regulator with XRE-family HTH domain